MRALRTLALVLVLAGAAVVAGIVALKSVDLNGYRDLVAAQVLRHTGRALRVDGRIELHVSFRPVISITGVHLANAPWAQAPAMVSVERAEAELALLPLLAGDPPGKRLRLEGVAVHLETDATGRANWAFGGEKRGEGAATGGALPLLNDVRIRDAVVTHHDRRTGARTRLVLATAQAGTHSLSTPVHLEAQGHFDGAPLQVEAEVVSLGSFIDARPLTLAARVQIGGASLQVAGKVADPVTGSGLKLDVQVEGEDLAALNHLAGGALPDLGPFHARFHLEDVAEGLRFSRLSARAGDSDAAGELELALGGARPRLVGALRGTRLDLDALLGLSDAPDGARVFSETPLELDGLRSLAADLDIAVEVGALSAEPFALEQVRGRLVIAAGRLVLEPLRFRWAGGDVQGRMALDAAAAPPGLEVLATANGVDAARALAALADSDLVQGRVDLAARLAARGRSASAMAASLSGEARLLMGSGHARTGSLETVVGGASKVLGTLFSGSAESAAVNCAAASFRIRDGVARARVLLVDTEFSTLRGAGEVDLGKETLNLVLKPEPKSATLNVAVPVEVGGTLTEPTFTPETLATARKIGGLIGILFYPPAALAGLAELGSGEENPCLELAAEHREGVRSLSQGGPAPAAEDATAVDRAVNGLKDLFGG